MFTSLWNFLISIQSCDLNYFSGRKKTPRKINIFQCRHRSEQRDSISRVILQRNICSIKRMFLCSNLFRTKCSFYVLCGLVAIYFCLILLVWKLTGWDYSSLKDKFLRKKDAHHTDSALSIIQERSQSNLQGSKINQDGLLISPPRNHSTLELFSTHSRRKEENKSIHTARKAYSNEQTGNANISMYLTSSVSTLFQLKNKEKNISVTSSQPYGLYSNNQSFYADKIIKIPKVSGSQNGFPYYKFEGLKYQLQRQVSNGSSTNETGIRPDTCNNCFHPKFDYTMNPKDVCQNRNVINLLIIIESSVSNIEQRNTIRRTWGSICNKMLYNISCLFVIGLSSDRLVNYNLQYESALYGDLMQINFTDAYANLTYKTLGGLKWVSKFCRHAKYVMKTDDDMYINTKLIPIMLEVAPSTGFFGGHCWGKSLPSRDQDSKWYVSYKQYSNNRFPPMCSGIGYIMSSDVLQVILISSRNIPFFHLEDAYIAMCLNKMSVLPRNLAGFSNMLIDFSPCIYRDHVMTSHGFSPTALSYIWKEIRMCTLPMRDYIPTELYNNIPYREILS